MYWGKITPKQSGDIEELRRNAGVYEVPEPALMLASATHILSAHMGFSTSAERESGVWADGSAIPLMSYSFIEYIMGLDLSGFDLLEIGGGDSTLFWSRLAKSVTTLEADTAWEKKLREKVLANTDLRASTPDALPKDMLELKRSFDAIIIDPAANRYRCAVAALKILNPGGFIVLDNSDWYPNTAARLRDGDLIQIDFHDFRPMHHFRCTTSLFLRSDFRPKPKHNRLPLSPVGGKNMAAHNNWDKPNG